MGPPIPCGRQWKAIDRPTAQSTHPIVLCFRCGLSLLPTFVSSLLCWTVWHWLVQWRWKEWRAMGLGEREQLLQVSVQMWYCIRLDQKSGCIVIGSKSGLHCYDCEDCDYLGWSTRVLFLKIHIWVLWFVMGTAYHFLLFVGAVAGNLCLLNLH